MKITIDASEPDIFQKEVFDQAVHNAIEFLLRADTKEAVAKNITDFSNEGYEAALLDEYTLKLIQQKGQIFEFSCVYPDDEPKSIFFNPIFLVNMARMLNSFQEHDISEPPMKKLKKANKGEFIKMFVLFVTEKILHEMFHLLNRRASPQMTERTNIPARDKRDTMLDGKEQIVEYTDFGTMLERDMLGGCWDLSSEQKALLMMPEFIVVYPSPATKVGRYLDPTTSSIDGHGAVLNLYGVYKSTTVPNFVTSMIKGSYPRLSYNLRLGSSSIDENDEGEDEGADVMFARF